MSKMMELGFVITASTLGAMAGFTKLSGGLRKIKEDTDDLAKTAKKLDTFDKARERLNHLNSEYMKSAEMLKKLKEEYARTGKGNAEFAKRVKEAETHVASLNRQKQAQQRTFQRARSAIEEEGHSLKTYRGTLAKVNKELKINENLKKIQASHDKKIAFLDKAQQYGDKALRRGVVAGALTLAPLKIYIDVEESQADLRKMLGDEAQKYYGTLREISDNSPLSQPEVFEIAGSLAQSGVASENLVEFTKKANQLKVAFDITTQEAGQFLAKTKEQLGLTEKEVFSFADTINYMSDKTASTASQLVDFSQRVGSVARTANVSKEANIALGATLIATGTEANVAATGIKQLYLELGKGADTKKKANALSFLGINGETLAHDMARDAEGTILSVLEKIKSSHAGDKIGLLTDIFGEQAANSIATLANDTDKLRENLSKAKSEMANGAVEKEYAERMKTLGTQLKVAKNQIMNSLADVGLALAPSIKNLLTATKPILENIATWIKQNPKLTSGLMKAIGAFALFSLGMGTVLKIGAPIGKFILTITTTFSKLKAAGGIVKGFSKVFPTLSKMGGFLTSPWILAGAVIIGIFVLLYNKSKWFRDGVNNAVKQIIPHVKELGRLLKEYLGVAMTWISNKSKSAGEIMKKVWNTLKPILSVVGKIIKVVIITAIQLVIFRIRNMMADFKLIVAVVKGVFNMVKGIIKAAIGVIKGIFGIYIAFVTGKWNEIPKIAQNAWNMVKSGISSFVEGAKGILNGLFNWFGDKWNALKNLVANNPITVKVKETWDKVTGGGQGTPQKWTGTNYFEGGLTSVAERGAEMIKIPGQSPFIAQSEMLMNLPKGTEILNASRTKNTLRERVNRIKERASSLGTGGSTVVGGDTINITINAGSNSNANDIAREVKRVLAEMKNKKERVAFG